MPGLPRTRRAAVRRGKGDLEVGDPVRVLVVEDEAPICRRHAVIAIEARECIHSDAMGSAFGV